MNKPLNVDFKAIEDKAFELLERLLERGAVEVAPVPPPKTVRRRSTRKRECEPRA